MLVPVTLPDPRVLMRAAALGAKSMGRELAGQPAWDLARIKTLITLTNMEPHRWMPILAVSAVPPGLESTERCPLIFNRKGGSGRGPAE